MTDRIANVCQLTPKHCPHPRLRATSCVSMELSVIVTVISSIFSSSHTARGVWSECATRFRRVKSAPVPFVTALLHFLQATAMWMWGRSAAKRADLADTQWWWSSGALGFAPSGLVCGKAATRQSLRQQSRQLAQQLTPPGLCGSWCTLRSGNELLTLFDLTGDQRFLYGPLCLLQCFAQHDTFLPIGHFTDGGLAREPTLQPSTREASREQIRRAHEQKQRREHHGEKDLELLTLSVHSRKRQLC